ncbi:DNA topoisomerase IV alpha subunit [Schizopora paradoxa]|uniref:DNA topoisomerase (ATP-hydrolyzing) n=1 Tax=Schizopora paradoxa TaxID=27342 RepID=A0A0H2RRX4_9AGAM|nr:DNA topoisomerase IV alpha subunit [Schizopora paradoxa]
MLTEESETGYCQEIQPMLNVAESMDVFGNENVEDGDDEDGFAEEGPDRESKRLESIELLENLALSFLSQLNNALSERDRDEHDDDQDATNAKGRKRHISLELADRTYRSQCRTLQFPKRSKGPSIKPIAQLLRVVDLSHEALVNDAPVTKRDIYYRDVALFKSQAIVNSLVDDLAATIDVTRADLNIRASAKGLFCGSCLRLSLHNGDEIWGQDFEPSLIPVGEEIANFKFVENVSWVLIVEKDAVFQTLCGSGFARNESLPGRGLLITGKGYPDVATRQLVKALSDNLPSTIPIMALVDADPYGIDIALTYKYGSKSMKHQNEGLAARRVQWMGVSAADIFEMGIDRDAMLPITVHDHKKALSMLCSPDIPLTGSLRHELTQMLHTRRKAEIEVIASARQSNSGGQASGSKPVNPLLRYLEQKISKWLALFSSLEHRMVE